MESRTNLYLCLSALITALVVTLASGLLLKEHRLFSEAIAWQSVIIILFAVLTFPQQTESQSTARPINLKKLALWLLPPFIFMLGYRVHLEFFFIYTIIWVACLPDHVSKKTAWIALLAVNLAWFLYRMTVWNDDNPLVEALLVSTFHAFALLSALAAKDALAANVKTQTLNRELLATQHLLGEASRNSERTRIARDLHDLLGHHLTALTINLQVAGRIADDEAKDKIDQCHALAKLLLSDVRDAVSTLRDMPVVNLRELLDIAIRDIPRLQIQLDMPDDLALDDMHTAEALLRCVQESITNTLKHSTANKALIEVREQSDRISLKFSDNGQGTSSLTLGNGLIGMRERFERLGGELTVNHQPNMSVQACVPLSR